MTSARTPTPSVHSPSTHARGRRALRPQREQREDHEVEQRAVRALQRGAAVVGPRDRQVAPGGERRQQERRRRGPRPAASPTRSGSAPTATASSAIRTIAARRPARDRLAAVERDPDEEDGDREQRRRRDRRRAQPAQEHRSLPLDLLVDGLDGGVELLPGAARPRLQPRPARRGSSCGSSPSSSLRARCAARCRSRRPRRRSAGAACRSPSGGSTARRSRDGLCRPRPRTPASVRWSCLGVLVGVIRAAELREPLREPRLGLVEGLDVVAAAVVGPAAGGRDGPGRGR